MVKQLSKLSAILLVLLLGSRASNADQIISRNSFIEIGNRVFNFRTDVSKIFLSKEYFPITKVKWIRAVAKQDHLLSNTSLQIQVQHQVPGQPHQTFFGNREGEKIARNHPSSENIPEMFRFDGFEARSRKWSVLLYPTDRQNKLSIICSTRDVNNLFCSLVADYPPDPDIFLSASIYSAKPPFHFAEIADRMREIAYCLDVTEQVKSEAFTPQIVQEDDPQLPTLKDCREVVS